MPLPFPWQKRKLEDSPKKRSGEQKKWFDMVKVRDNVVRETERIYKDSYRGCWRDRSKSSR